MRFFAYIRDFLTPEKDFMCLVIILRLNTVAQELIAFQIGTSCDTSSSYSMDKLLLRAFSLVHSLRSGPSLQHSIKACQGQRPRTPGVFQYRGFCLILIHSTNSFNFFFKLPQVLHKQLHRSPTQLN